MIAAIMAMAACTKTEEKEYFNIDSTDLVLTDGTAGSTDILLATNRDPVAVVEDAASEWLSAVITRRCLTLTYTLNDSGAERTGVVNVTAGSTSIPVTVTQPVYVEPEPEPDPDEPGVVTSYSMYDVYYENGEAAGIVFWASEDGQQALVVSLDRLGPTAWSSDGSHTIGTGPSDGAENTRLCRESEEAAYIPALAFCDQHGEGWYWPAMDEMLLLYAAYNGTEYNEKDNNVVPAELPEEQKAARARFDELLTSNGGTIINTQADTERGDEYWTSTEQEKDGVVYGSAFRFGKAYASGGGDQMSKTNNNRRYIRCVKFVSLDGSGQDEPDVPVDTKFQVYRENDKNVGIIYWTSDDGATSKVLSLTRSAAIPWSYTPDIILGASDMDDGAANTELLAASSDAANIPALQFCESLGEGWYWPALNELVEIFGIYNGAAYVEKGNIVPAELPDEQKEARAAFDLSLTAYGGTVMNAAADTEAGDRYWSSTELSDDTKGYGSFMVFGKAYMSVLADTPGKGNSTGRYARCIKVIANE